MVGYVLVAGESGCGSDAAGEFGFLMFLGKCMVGIFIVTARLCSFEGVYCLSVEPVVFDTTVQGGLLELFVHATAQSRSIIPDSI